MGDSDSNARTDLEGLKALAHPLRITIIDVLSTHGPQTASGLAERLGESSGSTSYHLRQLAKHGYVQELVDRGTARERWWQRVPAPIFLADEASAKHGAGVEASRVIMREFAHHREQYLREFIERGRAELAAEWLTASSLTMSNLHVTAEQLSELRTSVSGVIVDFVDRHRGQRVPGSRPVLVQFYAFPVIDGVEIPRATIGAAESSRTATTTAAETEEGRP